MGLQAFGARVRSTMEDRGETPTTLAAKLGVTVQAVHKWLAGNEITLPNLRLLASMLGVNWLWLRYGDEVVNELAPPKFETDDALAQYRQRLIDEIIASDRRRRWGLERLGVGMFEQDMISQKRFWGPGMRRLLGIPLDMSPTAANFYSLLAEEEVKSIEEWILKAASGGRHYHRFRVKAMPDVLFEGMLELIVDQELRPVKILGLVKRFHGEEVTLKRLVEQAEQE